MKRTTITLALLIVALAFATIGVQPANAAPPLSVAFGAQLTNGCLNGGARFVLTFSVPDPLANYTVHTIASVGGLVYMDEQFTRTGNFFLGVTSWGIFDENDTGLQNASWPIPTDSPVHVTINFAGATSSVDYVCGNGVTGRPIPDGFVLRTITCTVAVFDAPNGNPVAGATIKGGQTWYVNPVSVSVAGSAKFPKWTEIYVSGSTNGYIPTSCVGPAPAVGN